MDMLETETKKRVERYHSFPGKHLEEGQSYDKEMKKYTNLYEAEKYEFGLWRFQEDHIDEEEIISQHKK